MRVGLQMVVTLRNITFDGNNFANSHIIAAQDGGTIRMETGSLLTNNGRGGAWVTTNGILIMAGGKVTDTRALNFVTGGIHVNAGRLIIESGSVIDISGNMGADGLESNVYLANNQYIEINGTPAAGSAIGITKPDNGNVFVQSGGAAAHIPFFFDDGGGYIFHDDGRLIAATPGSVHNWHVINDEDDLRRVGRGQGWGLNSHYILDNDIDLTSDWIPIPRHFAGSFDGGGFTISDMNIVANSDNGQSNTLAMFTTITATGRVENLTLDNISINGTGWLGGIVADNLGLVSNCYVSGVITGTDIRIGGIAGRNSGTIQKCGTNVTITGLTDLGGIAGNGTATSFIRNCFAYADITSIADTDIQVWAGGINGGGGSFENITAAGNIDAGAGRIIGGLVASYAPSNDSEFFRNGVALNQSLSANRFVGRAVGINWNETNRDVNTYSISDMTVNGSPEGRSSHGTSVTANQWKNLDWWQNTAFNGISNNDWAWWQPHLPPAIPSPPAVTVSGSLTGDYADLTAALNAIGTTAGTYTITLYENQTLAGRTISANQHITLVGDTAEQEIRLSAAGTMFTINTNSSLTLGNNITLVGFSGNNNAVVNIVDGTFTMLTGSKITGNSSTATSNAAGQGAAVRVAGGMFNLRGGIITGNTATSSISNQNIGGVFVFSSSSVVNLESGSIKGNTGLGGDVYMTQNAQYTISGTVELGTVIMNGDSTNGRAILNIDSDWTGNIDALNLRGTLTNLTSNITTWENQPVLTGSGVNADSVSRIGLGVFTNSTTLTQPIENTHYLDNSGVLRPLGTDTNPFIITTEAQLRQIGTTGYPLSAHYKLEEDITLTSNWTTIAGTFTGTFDGNGHVIRNLTGTNGLFNEVSGTVKDLGLDNVNINSTLMTMGAITRTLSSGGNISGCFVTGSVTSASSRVGGIVGANSGTIENSYSTANVSSSSTGAGGIAGENFSGSIIRYCYATGNIAATNFGGGIVGYISSGTVTNCAALNLQITRNGAGTLTGFGRVVGQGGTRTNNYGMINMPLPISYTNAGELNGVHGYFITPVPDTLVWTDTANWSGGAWNSTIWSFADGRLPLLRAFPAPLGSAENPFIIGTPAELEKVGRGGDGWDLDSHYRLEDDVVLTSPWVTIDGTFTGTFDGNGHIISNLTGTNGVFWRVSGTVKDLGLENVNINGTTIQVGGITGTLNSGGLITGCFVTGSVNSSGTRVGGIVGSNSGTVENSYSTANVSSTTINNVGGIVGSNSGTIRYCYATGIISGTGNTGGISGFNGSGGSVINCAALNPTLTRTSGTSSSFGRVVGANNGTLTNNYAHNNMTLPVAPTNDLDDIHGFGIDISQFNLASTWEFSPNWSGGAWNDTIWNIANGRLPWLQAFGGIQGAVIWFDLEVDDDLDFGDDVGDWFAVPNEPEDEPPFEHDEFIQDDSDESEQGDSGSAIASLLTLAPVMLPAQTIVIVKIRKKYKKYDKFKVKERGGDFYIGKQG